MKEELSGLIGELKNDVDDKGTKIEEDRKAQYKYFLLILKDNLLFYLLESPGYFMSPTISFANPPYQQKSPG